MAHGAWRMVRGEWEALPVYVPSSLPLAAEDGQHTVSTPTESNLPSPDVSTSIPTAAISAPGAIAL